MAGVSTALLCLAGDTLRTWRTDRFVLLAGGPQWIPPTLPTATLAQQTAAQRGGDSKVRPQTQLALTSSVGWPEDQVRQPMAAHEQRKDRLTG